MDFSLRPWRMEDAAAIVSHANDEAVAKNLRDIFPFPYTLSDAENYIRACIESEGHGQLSRAIIVDGQPAGSVTLLLETDICRKTAELGYWLGRAFWGRGIMTAAVRQMCALGFAAWDIVRIEAEPFAENAASRRVLEKAGFTLEGTLRSSVYKVLGRRAEERTADSCIYGLVREEAPQ